MVLAKLGQHESKLLESTARIIGSLSQRLTYFHWGSLSLILTRKVLYFSEHNTCEWSLAKMGR